MSAEPQVVELRALAESVARAAGSLIEDGAGTFFDVSTKSTGTDMVTEVDRASEALITEQLLAARPHDAILGEEGVDIGGTSGVQWVVDPLDGTTNFLYDFPGYNVAIAAQVSGQTVAAAVYDVVRRELFSAAAGLGALLDGRPIRVADQADLGHALVGTGFAYDAQRRRAQAEVLVEVLPLVRDVRRQGAAAVDLCSVACGRLDAYYERGLAPWDVGAGGLIAQESGAVVDVTHDAGGTAAVVAAAPGIAAALGEVLARTGFARA